METEVWDFEERLKLAIVSVGFDHSNRALCHLRFTKKLYYLSKIKKNNKECLVSKW